MYTVHVHVVPLLSLHYYITWQGFTPTSHHIWNPKYKMIMVGTFMNEVMATSGAWAIVIVS